MVGKELFFLSLLLLGMEPKMGTLDQMFYFQAKSLVKSVFYNSLYLKFGQDNEWIVFVPVPVT